MKTLDKFKKANGFFGAVIGAAIITAVLGGFIIRAQWNQVSKVNKEVRGNRETLAAYEKKAEDLTQLKANYQSLEQKDPQFRKTILGVLPDTTDEERLIVAVRNMASQAGLVVNSIGLTSAPADKNVPVLAVNLNVNKVSYATMIEFFRILESSSRLAKTTSINLSGRGESLSATIRIFFYYQPLKGSV